MKTLFLNLGYKCNFDCVYCVIGGIQKEFNSEDFVSFEKIKQIDLIGYNSVWLTGGEPTLHPDFFLILDYFYTKNFNISMQTNGSMIGNSNFYDKIKKYKINYQLPLNSFNEKIHNVMMKHKNAYNLVLSGIKNLLENKNSILTVKIILTKLNYNHLLKTILFLINLGVKRFYIAYPVLKGNYLKYKVLAPNYTQIKKELDLLVEIEKKYNINYVLESFPYCILNEEQFKNVWEIGQFDAEALINSTDEEIKQLLNISINCFKKFGFRDEFKDCDNCKIVKFKHKLNNVSFLHKDLDKEINANCLDNIHKTKDKSCLNCNYNLICTGISNEYVNLFSFGEFDNKIVIKKLNKKNIIDYLDYINKND